MCNCFVCCKKINLTPANLGRLIKACGGKGTTSVKPRVGSYAFSQTLIRQEVKDFIRKLRLQYVFRNSYKPVPELYWRTGYNPGKTESLVLERFIAKLRETLVLVIKQRPLKPRKDNLGPRMRRALAVFQRQKQFLVFRKADKGSVIVVENVEVYIWNGREYLADPQVYQRLDRDGQELAQAVKQAVSLRLRRLQNSHPFERDVSKREHKVPETQKSAIVRMMDFANLSLSSGNIQKVESCKSTTKRDIEL